MLESVTFNTTHLATFSQSRHRQKYGSGRSTSALVFGADFWALHENLIQNEQISTIHTNSYSVRMVVTVIAQSAGLEETMSWTPAPQVYS